MILKAEKISKKFHRVSNGANYFYALHNTDFEIAENSLTMIKGRSGSGKTTFLNIIGGLLAPTTGKVTVNKTDLYSLSDKELSAFRNKNISMIPQGSTALHNLTVLENVLLPTLMYAKCEIEIEKYTEELLDKVGIAKLKHAMPSELSGGELRRMAIVRALITRPSLILADEPTGDLDDENTKAVLTLLRNTAREGTAIVLVTHEPEAAKYADCIYKMDAGNLIFQG